MSTSNNIKDFTKEKIKDIISENVKAIIWALLDKENLTVRQLANILGCDCRTIYNYLNDTTHVSLEIIYIIHHIYGLPYEHIIDGHKVDISDVELYQKIIQLSDTQKNAILHLIDVMQEDK